MLELALTHPSYRSNYGTNPDHAKNTLNNCGIIQTKVKGAKNDVNLSNDIKTGIGRKRGIYFYILLILVINSNFK